MTPRLKVCCIASIDEARLAIAAGASAVGLVGAMPSGPGPIDDALIARIAAAIPPPISRFLLTSRTEPRAVVEHARGAGVDTVQLVDTVPEATYAALRNALPHVRIVQVVHVQSETSIDEALRVAPHVDALLLDSGRPHAGELGGTGRVHDWSISRRIALACDRPVFLAGGLGAHNVAEAIREVRPFGIDVCSSIRTEGRLDTDKLARLVAAFLEEPRGVA